MGQEWLSRQQLRERVLAKMPPEHAVRSYYLGQANRNKDCGGMDTEDMKRIGVQNMVGYFVREMVRRGQVEREWLGKPRVAFSDWRCRATDRGVETWKRRRT